MSIAQYLLNYLFEKYKDEAIFDVCQYGLPVSTSVKLESISVIVYDANIALNSLRIICNYIRNAFGKRNILPKEAVHDLVTGHMEE